MPIIKGSTPTIRIVLSTDEVAFADIDKVYLTFAQKDSVITGLNTTFDGDDGVVDGNTITYSRKLTQSETLNLKEDVDLDCQVDVLTTGADRKVSKVFSFGVCKTLRNTTLPPV